MWYCVDGGWVPARFRKVPAESYTRTYNTFRVSVVVVGCKSRMSICPEDP